MHPNLVQVYDFGQTAGRAEDSEWGGRLFFVMERLEGEALDTFLDREKGVDWRDACELAIKTCRALEAAHSAGLVHRDLKPANLFLTFPGRRPSSFAEVGLKLLDFGVAKELRGGDAPPSASEAHGHDDPNLSKAGAVFGTPETMAPEQVTGGDVDGRADIYALGCVLYEMLTGRMPFDAPSPILMMSCHLRDDVRPPRDVAPERGIPESIERVVMKALAKDRGARFADAGEMREALEEACYGGFFVDSSMPKDVQERAAREVSAKPETIVHADGSLDIIITAEPSDLESLPVEMESVSDDRRRRRVFAPMVFAALASAAIVAFIGTGQKPFSREDVARMIDRVAPFAHATERLAPKSGPRARRRCSRDRPPKVAAAAAAAAEPKPAHVEIAARLARSPATSRWPSRRCWRAPAARSRRRSTPRTSRCPARSTRRSPRARPTSRWTSHARARKTAPPPRPPPGRGRLRRRTAPTKRTRPRSRGSRGAPTRTPSSRACSTRVRCEPPVASTKRGRRLDEILKGHPDHPEAKSMLKDLDLLHAPKVHAGARTWPRRSL